MKVLSNRTLVMWVAARVYRKRYISPLSVFYYTTVELLQHNPHTPIKRLLESIGVCDASVLLAYVYSDDIDIAVAARNYNNWFYYNVNPTSQIIDQSKAIIAQYLERTDLRERFIKRLETA